MKFRRTEQGRPTKRKGGKWTHPQKWKRERKIKASNDVLSHASSFFFFFYRLALFHFCTSRLSSLIAAPAAPARAALPTQWAHIGPAPPGPHTPHRCPRRPARRQTRRPAGVFGIRHLIRRDEYRRTESVDRSCDRRLERCTSAIHTFSNTRHRHSTQTSPPSPSHTHSLSFTYLPPLRRLARAGQEEHAAALRERLDQVAEGDVHRRDRRGASAGVVVGGCLCGRKGLFSWLCLGERW